MLGNSQDLPLLHQLARREKHAAAVRLGMSRAKLWGQKLGRPPESDEDFLSKPSSKKIKTCLAVGCSIAATAIVCQCSPTTVKKVKKLIGNFETLKDGLKPR